MLVAGVREVVEVVPVPHGHGVGAFPVGDSPGLAGLEVHQPDVAGHAAAVPLPGSAVALVRGVGDPGPGPVDRGVRAVGHRKRFGEAAVSVDPVDPFSSRHAAHATGAEEQVAVGGPVAEPFARRVMGDASGHSALGGDHVDVAVAVIVSDERDLAAVGRKTRDRLRRPRERRGAGRSHPRPAPARDRCRRRRRSHLFERSGNRYIEAPPSVSTATETGVEFGTIEPIDGVVMRRAVVALPASRAAMAGFVMNMWFSERRVGQGRESAGGEFLGNRTATIF